MNREGLDAGYYQSLHDDNPAFQNNNWLLQDLALLRRAGGESILELGCGNGLFLQQAAQHWSHVTGLDWAKSPRIDAVTSRSPNVEFIQADVRDWRPGRTFDIVASADFLEHLPPDVLTDCLDRIHAMAPAQFHRIACYDDGHSHLSIFPPAHWLELFTRGGMRAYSLLSCEPRKGNPANLVITIGTSDVFA